MSTFSDIVNAIDARIKAVVEDDLTTINDLTDQRLDGLGISRTTTLKTLLELRRYYEKKDNTNQTQWVETDVRVD